LVRRPWYWTNARLRVAGSARNTSPIVSPLYSLVADAYGSRPEKEMAGGRGRPPDFLLRIQERQRTPGDALLRCERCAGGDDRGYHGNDGGLAIIIGRSHAQRIGGVV